MFGAAGTATCSSSLSARAAQPAFSPAPLKCHFGQSLETVTPSGSPSSQPFSASSSRAARQRGGPVAGLGGPDAVQTVMVGGSVAIAASMAFYYGFKGDPVSCEGCGGAGGVKCFACSGSGTMGVAPEEEGAETPSRAEMIRRARKSGGSSALRPRGPRPGECRVCRGAGLILCKRCRGSGYQRRM